MIIARLVDSACGAALARILRRDDGRSVMRWRIGQKIKYTIRICIVTDAGQRHQDDDDDLEQNI